ncbi:hypothetical protein H1R20_g14317, partial [Candolleomyces eurysporus]
MTDYLCPDPPAGGDDPDPKIPQSLINASQFESNLDSPDNPSSIAPLLIGIPPLLLLLIAVGQLVLILSPPAF